MKPSIYAQLQATQVAPGPFTMPSPRHWNPGMIRYKGRLWMCYRYHLPVQNASRCATALCPLDKVTFQPTALSQHLNLPATIGDEHFEDARLFMFKGQPHISWTQMTGYRPGVDFKCIIKYARLKLLGNRWLIEEVFWPKFGRNDGTSKEKNWAFFEHDGALHCIYSDEPAHKVIRLDGERVVAEWDSEPAFWPWGVIRGGAPPIPYGDGKLLVLFHSSLPTEEAPHYVRYYAGAYVMDAKPPFAITAISSRPIAAGSEADGHGMDPRYSAGWKPYVVFPCGCVPDGDEGWLVSLGINDWQCAIGHLRPEHLRLIAPNGSAAPSRFFRVANGTIPIQYMGPDRQPQFVRLGIPCCSSRSIMVRPGYYATCDGREAEVLSEAPRVEEIPAEVYYKETGKKVA